MKWNERDVVATMLQETCLCVLHTRHFQRPPHSTEKHLGAGCVGTCHAGEGHVRLNKAMRTGRVNRLAKEANETDHVH